VSNIPMATKTAEEILAYIYDETGTPDAIEEMTERIFCDIDDLQMAGDHWSVQLFLKHVDVDRLDSFRLRSILVATRNCLGHRPSFFRRAYKRMVKLRGIALADRLLRNLG